MVSHIWGDDFDFARLTLAGAQVASIYEALSGHTLIWKEKYGTIRYEASFKPAEHTKDIEVYRPVDSGDQNLVLAILVTIQDYPDMASELIDDLLFFDDATIEKITPLRPKSNKADE